MTKMEFVLSTPSHLQMFESKFGTIPDFPGVCACRMFHLSLEPADISIRDLMCGTRLFLPHPYSRLQAHTQSWKYCMVYAGVKPVYYVCWLQWLL